MSWDQVKGVSGSHEAAQILFPARGTQSVRVGVNVYVSVVLALASSDHCRVPNTGAMPCALLCLSVRQQTPSHVSPAQGLLGLHQAGPRDHSLSQCHGAGEPAFRCTPVSRCLFITWDSGPWGCPYEMAAELSRLREKIQAKREKRVAEGRQGKEGELTGAVEPLAVSEHSLIYCGWPHGLTPSVVRPSLQ